MRLPAEKIKEAILNPDPGARQFVRIARHDHEMASPERRFQRQSSRLAN
jgi:hypothetical protein